MRIPGDENVPTLRLVDFCLRFLVIPLSVASIWLTVTNHQDNTSLGSIHFTKIKGLKYMVSISAISGGYALIALVASCVKHLVDKAWVFFVSDQVVAYLMVTSGAAMAELDYLAYNGDTEVTWSEACSSYGRFCSRLNLILVVNAIALFCFFWLAVISAYRVFSRFEPPFVASKDVDEQVT